MTASPTLIAAPAFLADAKDHVDEHVELRGWVEGVRPARNVAFLTLRDRTGTLQVVCRADLLGEASRLPRESAIRATGVVRENTRAGFGSLELHADGLEVLALAGDPEPTGRDVELRSPDAFLVFAVQSTLTATIRSRLHAEGFVELHTPKLTAAGSESGAAVFELRYFDEPAYLAQSPQFYMQLAMAAGFDRAYEVGPVFRAETGLTNRHAAEFTCLDVELAWVDGLEALMSLEEDLLREALAAVRDAHGDDIRTRFGVTVDVPEETITRVTHAEALELLGHGRDGPARLSYRDEQALCRRAREDNGHGFVFVTDYPTGERPFYTMGDGATTRSFDLLWRGLEITSGCQREHRHARLAAQAAAGGLSSDALARYLDACYLPMFRRGCPPHGGFGIGLERLTMALLGRPSLHDTSLVFRGPGRLRP
jgi:aspartyl/asparaginyl-tRNA synthetase